MPIVIVTADITGIDRATLMDDIDAFVPKPFNAKSLAAIVGQRIEAARLRADAVSPVQSFGDDDLGDRLFSAVREASITGTPIALALLRIRNREQVIAEVGTDGLAFVVRELMRLGRARLPQRALLGRNGAHELAVLLTDAVAIEAERAVVDAVVEPGRCVRLPGGAAVDVTLAVGVAAFPEHASDADELYMAADAALAHAAETVGPQPAIRVSD
jgi:GGDEF domain-containing protein